MAGDGFNMTDAQYHKYFKAASDAILKRWRLKREEKKKKDKKT